MYKLAVKENLDKKLLRFINMKVQNILKDPYRYKPLKKPLQNKRRVHIGGSFVLIYEINKKEKVVTLFDFDHHDNIYKSY